MASTVKRVKARIECVSPMLTNPMGDEILEGLRTGIHRPVDKETPATDIAAKRMYRENGDSGPIGLPVTNMLACLVEAGRRVKNGKSAISTATTTTLYSFLSIDETFLPFLDLAEGERGEGWVTDKRRGRLQDAKRTAVCIVRPRFDRWAMEMTMMVDEQFCREATVKQLFETAGRVVGLCDFRPACKGPFGRFKLAKWEVVEEAA